MKLDHSLVYHTASGRVIESDLTKRQAKLAAQALRTTGVPAFIFPTTSLHLVTLSSAK